MCSESKPKSDFTSTELASDEKYCRQCNSRPVIPTDKAQLDLLREINSAWGVASNELYVACQTAVLNGVDFRTIAMFVRTNYYKATPIAEQYSKDYYATKIIRYLHQHFNQHLFRYVPEEHRIQRNETDRPDLRKQLVRALNLSADGMPIDNLFRGTGNFLSANLKIFGMDVSAISEFNVVGGYSKHLFRNNDTNSFVRKNQAEFVISRAERDKIIAESTASFPDDYEARIDDIQSKIGALFSQKYGDRTLRYWYQGVTYCAVKQYPDEIIQELNNIQTESEESIHSVKWFLEYIKSFKCGHSMADILKQQNKMGQLLTYFAGHILGSVVIGIPIGASSSFITEQAIHLLKLVDLLGGEWQKEGHFGIDKIVDHVREAICAKVVFIGQRGKEQYNTPSTINDKKGYVYAYHFHDDAIRSLLEDLRNKFKNIPAIVNWCNSELATKCGACSKDIHTYVKRHFWACPAMCMSTIGTEVERMFESEGRPYINI